MKSRLYLDTETYSTIPITNGTHRYAENAEIIMWQYAIDDGEVEVIDGDEPYRIMALLELLRGDSHEIVIHNSAFDRAVIRYFSDIDIPATRVFDSMVCALAHSLPGSLNDLCEVLGIPSDKAKDKEGKALINLFCKPQPKGRKILRASKSTHPAEWEKFRNYGKMDIIAMREVCKLLPVWNYCGAERALWELDQRINDRGVCVDLALANAAIRACTEAQKNYAEDAAEMTSGAVASANQRSKLLDFIAEEYGVILGDLTSSTVEKKLLEANIPEELRELLMVRLQASKTSVSKYKRVTNGVNEDGRLRGLLQFCGAARTGRWAGRLFQPQNLPRPSIKNYLIELGIEELKASAEGLV